MCVRYMSFGRSRTRFRSRPRRFLSCLAERCCGVEELTDSLSECEECVIEQLFLHVMAMTSYSRSRVAYFLLAALAVATTTRLLQGAEAAQTNTTSLCSPHATPPPLTKGEVTYVCINVNDDFRAVFMPVADKFTVLRVTDCTSSSACTITLSDSWLISDWMICVFC